MSIPNSPKPRQPVPANLARFTFKRGESGNPGGRTVAYAECRRLCREASQRAAERLVELIESADERIALMAADKVLERAWGKPQEVPPDRDHDIRKLPPDQRKQRILELLAIAAALQVPEDHEANRLDEAPEGSGETTQGVVK